MDSFQTLTDKVDRYLSSAASQYRFNGVVLIAKDDSIRLHKGYGWKDVKNNTLHDANSIFGVGSITKQFTAAVVLKLQEQGKLSVHDKLGKFFPEFANGDRITIHHLLTHTSGLYNYTSSLPPYKFIFKKTISQKKIVNTIQSHPLHFEPGTRFEYTNSGYYLLGMIIEKTTGKPYEQVVREMVLQPLRMAHTGFDYRNLVHPSKTSGYSVFHKSRQAEAANLDSTVLYAAGGLYSTAGDLYTWLKGLSGQQILSEASRKLALTAYKSNYAYGWIADTIYGRHYITHGGQTPNFSSYILYFPEEGLSLILLSNTAGDLWSMGIALAQRLFAQSNPWGNGSEIQPEETLIERFSGTYAFDDKSQFFVHTEQGKIILSGSPATWVSRTLLVALSETKFYSKTLDLELEFVKDKDGRIEMLISKRGGLKLEWKRK